MNLELRSSWAKAQNISYLNYRALKGVVIDYLVIMDFSPKINE